MPGLRHIAIHVEEPRPGRFAWVLSERAGRSWHTLQRAGTAAASYQRAMADGLLALQALVPDLDTGPRHPHDDAAPHDGPAPEPQAAAPARAFFGFGPAR